MADKNKTTATDEVQKPEADPNWTPLEKYLDELAQKKAQEMVDREMIDLGGLPLDQADKNADWIKTAAKRREGKE